MIRALAIALRELGEADQRRIELATAVVRVGAECDTKERALIAAYEGVRRTVNAAGLTARGSELKR